MDNHLKQRLVGAAVLASLAVIFLPALFHQEQRKAIDTTSKIPPAPVIQPIIIPEPKKPEGVSLPPPEELFQPEIVAETTDADKPVEPVTTISKTEPSALNKETTAPNKELYEKPRLTESGVPVGWVIQVASFKSESGAKTLKEKLLKQSYRAYSTSVTTASGEFHRVFVGPYIDKSRAQGIKENIDTAYKVDSRVLRFNPVSGN